MESFWQDVRYAVRQLRTQRQFSIAALLVLGLGIGANATIFTVVDRVLLSPLPYHAPGDLVMIWERNARGNVEHNVVSPQNYLDWKERATSFTDLADFTWSSMTLLGGTAPEHVYGRSVTPNLFSVLGTAPALGRTFTAAEGKLGAPNVVILSDGLWRQRYGADAAIVGKTIRVSGGDATVVGVMPANFRPLANEVYWDPCRYDTIPAGRRGRYTMVLGRLKPGVSVAKAQAEMSMIAKQLEAEAPQANTGWDASVITLADQVVGSSKRVIWMLFGAVTIVLLITCANVGNLMLTRAASRQRETAVRTALGAPRWRIARQWVVENVILAMAGGFVGIMLASYGVDLLVASGPRGVPRLSEIAVDWRVIGVTAAATIVIGLLIGLPAAFNQRSGMLASDLHGASGRTTGGVHAARFRAGLVVTQMSLAVVLLLAAGLLVRSLGRLAAVDPGFRADHVLTVSVSLPGDKYPDETRAAQFFGAFADRIKALPGVAAVGAVSMLPLQNGDAATSIHVVGRPEPPAGQAPIASVRVADEGYFGAMKIPVRRGRVFSSTDNAQAPRAIVISESLANKIWPNEDPIGRRLRVDYARNKDDELQVIGVVGDVRHAGLDEDTRETIYYPVNQFNYSNLTFVVRASGRADALAPSVRGVLREMDPNVPAEDLATMEHWLARSMNDRRDPMLLLTIFAVLAVTIAAVGVYAVLSFGVSQRTREIGVRMALGAQPRAVLAMVLGGGLRLTLAGIAIGAAAGMFATRALDKLLFHVQPTDPVTMGAVALLLGAVAFAAMYVPARRAARVDPVVALRSE